MAACLFPPASWAHGTQSDCCRCRSSFCVKSRPVEFRVDNLKPDLVSLPPCYVCSPTASPCTFYRSTWAAAWTCSAEAVSHLFFCGRSFFLCTAALLMHHSRVSKVEKVSLILPGPLFVHPDEFQSAIPPQVFPDGLWVGSAPAQEKRIYIKHDSTALLYLSRKPDSRWMSCRQSSSGWRDLVAATTFA